VVLVVFTAAYALSRRGRGMYCGAISFKVDEDFDDLHIQGKHLIRTASYRNRESDDCNV
jgi:hypothetical protein